MNLEYMLKVLRGAGWMVAVHNDYRLNGNLMTFWLFTHPSGRYVKGEGETDHEAVSLALAEARIPIPTTNEGILAEFDALAWKVRETMSR